MTKLISILLLILCLNIQANDTVYHRNYNGIKTAGLFTLAVVLNGVGDGLNNNNQKPIGHLCNAGSIATLLAIPLLTDVNKRKWYYYLASYTLIRVSLFDFSYNIANGQKLNYIGNTSYTDKFWNKQPIQGYNVFRSVSIVVGVRMSINEL
jgi:hypothetical protein